ncbi:MAG: serine/threonine-protein kinase [Gemmatimonadetes bacterium]|nr:serine/threonine-protein kinase [Gemmatimonadota bacterium]
MADDVRNRLAAALGEQYELGPEIGRGGMGIVYCATDKRLERDVAIKVLPPELSYRDDLRRRFTREAQLAGGLSHPNIVPIYNVDEAQGLVWYEMAFVDGESVRDRVARDGPLTELQTRRIVREVAWALAYAHARGIVHRDIKPDNILLESGTGRALVTDFGIAKIAEGDTPTLPGTVLGSLMYMSPEQATGEDVDGRADIYSLGLCGHFMLSGEPPFAKATIITVAARIATGATPEWDTIEQPIDPSFRQLLERCVAADPNDRWQDAEDILEALGPLALAPRPMPASIRRLVRDFMLIPTVGFLVLVIDIVAGEGLTLAEFLAWMGIALGVNFFITLRKFTERGFRWPDLREGLEMEIARQAEELEATGALKDRVKALVYIAMAIVVSVGMLELALQAGLTPSVLLVAGALAAGGVLSLPFSWLQMKILNFFGRLFMKLLPSLPRPEAEGWFSRFADSILTKLFRPVPQSADAEHSALPVASSGWSTSDVGAARRSTRSIDDLFGELPREVRRLAQPAREMARELTSAVDTMRRERAQIDRDHGSRLAALTASSKQTTHALEHLRALLEQVAAGDADPSEIQASVERAAAVLRTTADPDGQSKKKPPSSRSGNWLGGVLLKSAVTGSAPYREEDTDLHQLAADLTSEWDRHDELRTIWPEAEEALPELTTKMHRLHASLALHKQRGRRIDPGTAASLTECETLLADLLNAIKGHEIVHAGDNTQEIDGLVRKINDLHVEIDSALLVVDEVKKVP